MRAHLEFLASDALNGRGQIHVIRRELDEALRDFDRCIQLDPRDPATFAHIRELWRFASRLPPLFAPGVYRYRSIEESDRAREQALIERMRTMRAQSRRDR